MGKNNSKNKRCLSAEGCSLLPSALRPRLLGQKFIKNTQFWAILALFQIVAASTIFGYLCSNPVSAASLTLTVPSSFSLDITPSANGTFVKSDSKSINVKTDNSSGYTLSIKAKNSENGNALLNGNNKLNSISEQTSEDNFKSDSKFNNTWGYLPSKFNNKDNTNFLPGPTTEESILEATDEANETGTDYDITLGAKVDNNTITGTYNNNFVFSVTTNGPKYDAIMQDWAADYTNCEDLPSEQVINLLDKRDNNVYKVAKLKDGKCWMVENLRLGDDKLTNRTLTSANTDISSNFTLPASIDSGFNDYDIAHVHIDVTHGGYYNWYTATGGTGRGSTSTGSAMGSICPKGWRLPTSGDTSSDFSNLTKAYGGTGSNETNAAVRDALMASPIPGFTYSGSFFSDSLEALNSNGYWWSTTAGSGDATGQAYYLNLGNDGSVNPLDMHYKDLGASVRCLTEPYNYKRYSITYDLNGGENGPESPQTGQTEEDNVTLSSIEPSREGYTFWSWCDEKPTGDYCNGSTSLGHVLGYRANAQYPIKHDGQSTTLYAGWEHIPKNVTVHIKYGSRIDTCNATYGRDTLHALCVYRDESKLEKITCGTELASTVYFRDVSALLFGETYFIGLINTATGNSIPGWYVTHGGCSYTFHAEDFTFDSYNTETDVCITEYCAW